MSPAQAAGEVEARCDIPLRRKLVGATGRKSRRDRREQTPGVRSSTSSPWVLAPSRVDPSSDRAMCHAISPSHGSSVELVDAG